MSSQDFLRRAKNAVNHLLGRQPMSRCPSAFDDDLWITSYPKSGNTWTRFLIANLTAPDTVVDWSSIENLVPDIYLNDEPALRHIARPRRLKSHEPFRPEYGRVLLIVRDPRDVAVSYFHYARKSDQLAAGQGLADFAARFLAGRFDPFGSWGENVGSWLGARDGTDDFMVVRYEDLLRDTAGELAKVARQFAIAASDEQIRTAVANSSADRMRELEAAQAGQHKALRRMRSDIPFVRKAAAAQWQTELDAATVSTIEQAWGGVMRRLGYL